ncbi:unnamed protein product [Prorocentrum cordatum]|uniref:Sodium/calcium exchanger membrane region domain-containing protein n=1 Tax=Prorocentrum cordatum TaxID=2364126 RepID=A0ABN9UM52_9DINO|nr:unnamed protein product [Polarella glacialis]
MGIGTLMVLLFSDPMVDVLSEWGVRTGVPSFYVSFVLAPFASNASELLAAYSYASKKTPSSITNSLSSLLGAACMNNTFCLGIFLALCYFQGLAWQFTAETIAIIFVQWLIGGLAMLKDSTIRLASWLGSCFCWIQVASCWCGSSRIRPSAAWTEVLGSSTHAGTRLGALWRLHATPFFRSFKSF